MKLINNQEKQKLKNKWDISIKKKHVTTNYI